MASPSLQLLRWLPYPALGSLSLSSSNLLSLWEVRLETKVYPPACPAQGGGKEA